MNAFLSTALVAAVAAVALRYAARQRRLLHLYQLEHYSRERLLLWLRRRGELVLARETAVGALLAAAAVTLYALDLPTACAAVLLGGGAASLGLAVSSWRQREIKPLVFTGRAKRLYALSLLPAAVLLGVALEVALADSPATGPLAAVVFGACLLLLAAPALLLLASGALAPVQKGINDRYLRRARGRLADWRPLVVGITGSYGKTTTKFCVGEVLGAERPTLVTPESYNSFLGVTRTINERLTEDHRAFVVEMGAYRPGDIRELCELVRPSIAIITAIGPAHLERFGSIDAIAQAKAEIVEGLPPDGHFVTNADDERCREIAARSRAPVSLFSLEDPAADVWAGDIRLAEGRTSFVLHLEGEAHPVSSNLLGRPNVANLLAAAAAGRAAGIAPATIASALGRVRAPAHRLQPIVNRQAGVVVIDDAYNSNPTGARAALEVLREHEGTRRLLVTPGMVELGELEEELNEELGRQAAAVCDRVILVGRRQTQPILRGLRRAGFADERIDVVADVGEASSRLAGLTAAGDVVLFENDLPDTYAETGASAAPAGRRAAAQAEAGPDGARVPAGPRR